jgi:anti-anti-sigma factor
MALQTSIDSADGRVPITIVSLEGELDASNFTGLIEAVQGLYASGTRHLLLDLTGLRFMASSGLVALHSVVRILHGEAAHDPEAGWNALHALEHAASSGSTQAEVQLCGPQPAIGRVLERTGLNRLFVVHADRASAIAAF